jgi:hypothetical protein
MRREGPPMPERLDERPYAGQLFKPQREAKARPKGLRAKKPLKASNPKRRAEKYARNFSGTTSGLPGHDDFVRSLPCAVLYQRRSDVEAAHVEGRKMGGAAGDWRELVPLTRQLHRELDRIGLDAFERKHGINLRGLRHALVVADPGVSPAEQLAAWRRLLAEFPDIDACGRVLQHAWDLCGHKVEPPRIADGEAPCES